MSSSDRHERCSLHWLLLCFAASASIRSSARAVTEPVSPRVPEAASRTPVALCVTQRLCTSSASPPPSPGPGAAEVALCEEEGAATLLGRRASRPLIASRGRCRCVHPRHGPAPARRAASWFAPAAGRRRRPFDNPFGDGTLDLFTIGDPAGDGPLDIERTRWGEVELTGEEARDLRRDDRIVVTGSRRNDVLKAGRFQAVCVELAADPVTGDSIHIATDTSDNPFRRTPTSVPVPTGELANVRDLVHALPSTKVGRGRSRATCRPVSTTPARVYSRHSSTAATPASCCHRTDWARTSGP